MLWIVLYNSEKLLIILENALSPREWKIFFICERISDKSEFVLSLGVPNCND